MSYSGVIKTYDPSTGALEQTLTGVALSLKFSLGSYHGCLGGELVLSGSFRDDFLLDNGDLVKAFYNSTDTDPYYTGYVERRERSLEGFSHTYELAGLWRLFEGVTATADYGVDSTSIGTIVAYLFNTYIGGEITNITDDDSDIVCATVLTRYDVKTGDNIAEHFEDLAMLAGQEYAYGVDATGQFFFKAISTDSGDYQIDAEVASTAIRAKETKDKTPRNNLTVVGGYNASYGSRAKKRFTGSGTLGRPLLANVRGLTKEADMETYAANWMDKYNTSNSQVSDLQNLHLDQSASPPLPWAGKFKFADNETSLELIDYVRQVNVEWGDFFRYSVQLGLAGNEDNPIERAERNSAAALDDEVGSADYEDLMALPDVTDSTSIPTDFPRGWTESAIDSKVAGGGGGSSTIGRGQVVHLWPIAPVVNETFHIYVAVDNGGTQFSTESGEGVTFYLQHINTSHTTSTSSQGGVYVSSSGTTELWSTNTGFSFSSEGYIRIVIATTTDAVTPTVVYDPIDISGGWPSLGASPGYANTTPAFPIVSPASTSAITVSVVYAGWLGIGS